MTMLGASLSDELGTDVTFASSSGPSNLGPVLAATGFNAVEQEAAEPEVQEAGIAGLVSNGFKAKPFTPS